MASVTIDLKAQITGYEQSLRALQSQVEKIDIGTRLGKDISKALSDAQKQLAQLYKNPTPKASSDTQIDSILERANRVGEAIQRVQGMMQGLTLDNLNFSALGSEITDLSTKINQLESDFSSKFNNGILDAVKNSEQLTSIFKELGVDTTTANVETLTNALSTGMKKAAEETAAAAKELDAAKQKVAELSAKQAGYENEPFSNLLGKQNIGEEISKLSNEYDKAISDMQAKLTEKLSKFFSKDGRDSEDANKYIQEFLSGLSPENIKEKINSLYSSLGGKGVFSKAEFYKQIFGVDATNINQVISDELFRDFDASKEDIRNRLRELVDSLGTEFTQSQSRAKFTSLLNAGDVTKAKEQALKLLEQAYEKIQEKIKALQTETQRATEKQSVAQTSYDAAEGRQQALAQADSSINTIVAGLQQRLQSQENEIANLKNQLNTLLQGQLTNVQSSGGTTGGGTGGGANELRASAEAAQMYKTELQQVQAAEQMIGKIQGVVQRWFSVYAAVRMVGNAIRSMISTVQALDKTMTEIAIVTNMSQNDLWKQMPEYTAMAREYAASIQGVYEVSQLYYQQGAVNI